MKSFEFYNKISEDITYFDLKSIGTEILGTREKKHNVFSLMPYLLKNIVPFKFMPRAAMNKTQSQKSIKSDLV